MNSSEFLGQTKPRKAIPKVTHVSNRQRFWGSIAFFLLGCIVLALLTFVCLRFHARLAIQKSYALRSRTTHPTITLKRARRITSITARKIPVASARSRCGSLFGMWEPPATAK